MPFFNKFPFSSKMAASTPSSSRTPTDAPASSRDIEGRTEAPRDLALEQISQGAAIVDDPAAEDNNEYEASDDELDEESGRAEESGGAEDATDRDEGTGREYETGFEEEQADGAPPAKRKRRQAPRRPNKLSTDTFVITRVDDLGKPASPVKAAQGYSNAVGCILRETVKITVPDIRTKETEHLRTLLLDRLFSRYSVPEADKNRVTAKALSMMSKSLNTWRYRANKMKDKDFETVIKPLWPTIDEADWTEFIQTRSDDEFKKLSEWGKDMREKIVGNHRLGSRGYPGKKPKWDKEDAKLIAAGKEPPFSDIQPGRGKDFVRARATFDPATGEPIFTHERLKDVHEELVTSEILFYLSYVD